MAALILFTVGLGASGCSGDGGRVCCGYPNHDVRVLSFNELVTQLEPQGQRLIRAVPLAKSAEESLKHTLAFLYWVLRDDQRTSWVNYWVVLRAVEENKRLSPGVKCEEVKRKLFDHSVVYPQDCTQAAHMAAMERLSLLQIMARAAGYDALIKALQRRRSLLVEAHELVTRVGLCVKPEKKLADKPAAPAGPV